jgi:hypothetical protein
MAGLGYFQGEKEHGTINDVVKDCTPGVTAAMVSRHLGTLRDAWRALRLREAGGPDQEVTVAY